MDDKQLKKITSVIIEQYDKFSQRADELEKHVTKLVTETNTRVDGVYKEVLDMRREQDIHQQQHRDIEKELGRLGKSRAVTHELKNKKSS